MNEFPAQAAPEQPDPEPRPGKEEFPFWTAQDLLVLTGLLKFVIGVKQLQASLAVILQRLTELFFQTGPNVNGLQGQGQFSGVPILLPYAATAPPC